MTFIGITINCTLAVETVHILLCIHILRTAIHSVRYCKLMPIVTLRSCWIHLCILQMLLFSWHLSSGSCFKLTECFLISQMEWLMTHCKILIVCATEETKATRNPLETRKWHFSWLHVCFWCIKRMSLVVDGLKFDILVMTGDVMTKSADENRHAANMRCSLSVWG